MEPENIAIFTGREADEFDEYMSSAKTSEEKEELKRAHEYYLKNCERRRQNRSK
jgi:hypothetical protein